MRYALVVWLVIGMLLVAGAQDRNLALSRSLVAVRISDAERQLTAFAPLLRLIDGIMGSQQFNTGKDAGHVVTNATAKLRELLGDMQQIPGVRADGDLWLVFMQPAPAAAMKPTAKQPVPAPEMPSYLLLPLADPQAFQAFVVEYTKAQATPVMQACGNYALVVLSGKPPAYTSVTTDLALCTTRGIAVAIQPGNFDIKGLKAGAPQGFDAMMAPITSVMKEQQQNLQRIEIGAAMQGDTLSLETFLLPVPNSPLAKNLTWTQTTPLAFDYAGYLPENLAMCASSGPMLQGAPGAANQVLRLGFGFLSMMLPPDQYETFSQSLESLMVQCGQGRAIGITTPQGQESAMLVAVYHTTGTQPASDAVRAFIKQLSVTPKQIMGGLFADALTLSLTPKAVTQEEVPIDIINVGLKQPQNPGAKGAAPQPVRMECRVAYLDDKMLFTLGADGGKQMGALIRRIRLGEPGFTAGARYQTMKGILADKARGFESYSPLDLCKVGISWMPAGKEKDDAMRFMSVFPPQTTTITTCQEVRDGLVHGEIILPGEQLNFFYSLLQAAQQAAKQNTPKTNQPGAWK